MGRGRTRALPRQRVSGCSHAAESCHKDVSGREIEKKVVRDAFADMLPEVLRGVRRNSSPTVVGYNWIDTLKAVTTAASVTNKCGKPPSASP